MLNDTYRVTLGANVGGHINRLAAMRRNGHLCLLILVGCWLLPLFYERM